MNEAALYIKPFPMSPALQLFGDIGLIVLAAIAFFMIGTWFGWNVHKATKPDPEDD